MEQLREFKQLMALYDRKAHCSLRVDRSERAILPYRAENVAAWDALRAVDKEIGDALEALQKQIKLAP